VWECRIIRPQNNNYREKREKFLTGSKPPQKKRKKKIPEEKKRVLCIDHTISCCASRIREIQSVVRIEKGERNRVDIRRQTPRKPAEMTIRGR